MTQKSLHDYFKVKGPAPKIQFQKSPKGSPSRIKKMSTIATETPPGTPSPKRLKKDSPVSDEQKNRVKIELNLENVAISNINMAMNSNSANEISLNEMYDYFSEHKVKLMENSIKYKGKINELYDKAATSMFKAVFVDVFLNKINCAYFNETELELIMSIYKLSVKLKIIITRLMKWKKPWYRVKDINESLNKLNIDDFPLDEITANSDENGIFKIINCDNNLGTFLEVMSRRELQDISKRLKRSHTASKEKMIEQLLGMAKMNQSLFPGVKSPHDQLLSIVTQVCGPSIQLSDSARNVINRLLTLAYPVQTRFESLSDVFWMITEVDMGKRIYPEAAVDYYPVFRNRQHLIDYVEAKSALIDITAAMKFKDWITVRRLSTTAYEKLMSAGDSDTSFANNEKDLTLPSHIRRFTASFVWSKVLMLSIDSPKKDPNYATFVGGFLKSLLDYHGVTCASAGRYYNELSAVEMKYNKNFDECARLIETALSEKRLSIVVEAELIERARKLAGKATGIAEKWKLLMATLNEERKKKFECLPIENYIEAKKMEAQAETVVKSVWLIEDKENSHCYAQVEIVAQSYYMRNGFQKGLHCEGSLPATLCACAFWNEIYNVSVPGAFICRYQHAPLDLWSTKFIENRQYQIQERIRILKSYEMEELCEFMHNNYVCYREYTSLMSSNLFRDTEDIKEIVRCMGQNSMIGLCLTLLNDFYHMSAGFPDLIVWNAQNLTYKIVEVKGPGDSLSVKQKLWINRLMDLRIDVEVCYVKAK